MILLLASYSLCQQLPANDGTFLFRVMSEAEPGSEITGTEEHLCWPGKVMEEMQCKVYLCILHPLCKATLPKKVEQKGLGIRLLTSSAMCFLDVTHCCHQIKCIQVIGE